MDLFYPSNLSNEDKFPNHIQFTFFERRSTWQSGLSDQVHLYMPEQIAQSETYSWEQKSMMDLGVQAGGDAVRALFPGVYDYFQTTMKAVTGAAYDIAQYQAGAIPNPYYSQLFRGVNPREFGFTFKLIPQCINDCDTIKDIITLFRKYALPASGSGATGFLLTYPGEVEIRYIYKNIENPYLHKFKRSVIKNIDLGYTGEGAWAVMRNGFPATTSMTIHLVELATMAREDVDSNY